MADSLKNLREEFVYLFTKFLDQRFCRSSDYTRKSERHFLAPIRFYLLGTYGNAIVAEAGVRHALAKGGDGRVDFLVAGTAIELAVQPYGCGGRRLSPSVNKDECVKLLQHDGPALLVLYDFSRTRSLAPAQLQGYRALPTLGRGNWRVSAFNILYCFRTGQDVGSEMINVRI